MNARRIARVPDLEAEVIRLTERLRLYEGQESTPETPVGFDGMVSEMSGTIQHQTARIAALEAKVKAADELLGFIDAKISWEINPSNYDHQQVCEMNASWIEIGLAVAACREVQS